MPDEIQNLIHRYEHGTELLPPLLRNLTEEQVAFKPSAAQWSIREVMAHLADSEPAGALRIRMAAAEGGTIAAYDQDLWAVNLLYGDPELTNFNDVITLLRIVRKRTALLLRKLPAEAFDERSAMHTERGRLTLREILRMYAEHVENHARQIERILAAQSAA